MLKERFIFICELVGNGTIQIVSRDIKGVVELQLPKTLWMQLTPEDLVRAIQGNLSANFFREVRYEITSQSRNDVNIRITL